MSKILDAIIIGQGLAGTALSHLFLEHNISFKIISSSHISSSSKIAAGIINPIVTKRYIPVWRANEFTQFCHAFYSKTEHVLNELFSCDREAATKGTKAKNFYYQKNIFKILGSEDENQFFKTRFFKDNTLKDYAIEQIFDINSDEISAPFGAVQLINTAQLNVSKYLDFSQKYFIQKNILNLEDFERNELKFEDDLVQYKDLKSKKIIFCEGYHAIQNPLFPMLKFNLVKGEVIQFKSESLKLDKILNKNVYIVPEGNDVYTAGATYEWKDLNENTTEKGIETLKNDLSKIIKKPFEIIQSKAGIRPATVDRRPYIGFLKTNKNIGIFNGLGTRGALLAPLLAKELLANMLTDFPIDKECDVNRLF